MIKLLIGGSPCTQWSIAKRDGREIEASGIGWELFENYIIAKNKFKPNFFLYENNKSASQSIKNQISNELGVDLMYINSSLVSAQHRQRFYAFNWSVELPENRNILLADIIESGIVDRDKAYPLLSSHQGNARDYFKKKHAQIVFEPVDNKTNVCSSQNSKRKRQVYEIKDGLITVHGQQYKVKLDDGEYFIRKLTPIECERLQTLPDDYTKAVSNARRYASIGNGWTAEVIIHILNGALKNIPKDEEIVVLSMYDGIGTGRYCLEKMGFTNIKYFAYEIDKYAKQIATSNYPDITQLGDAFDIRKDEWYLPLDNTRLM